MVQFPTDRMQLSWLRNSSSYNDMVGFHLKFEIIKEKVPTMNAQDSHVCLCCGEFRFVRIFLF